MIEWSGRLFVSDKIRKKLKKIKKKLDKPDRIRFGAFLITLNDSESDLFDIYNILMFPARYFKKDGHGVKIVGVAKNEDDAKELVGSIISSIIKEKGDISCDTVKEFFKS